MTLSAFKTIYWWEWSHRLLGRLLGVVFLVPFVWFAARRQIPRRLIWRLAIIFALGGLQGLVGWWMVASGLTARVYVAPERLALHLGLAFALLCALVWTALDAWAGWARQTSAQPVGPVGALALIGVIYLQILLGALVAGNDAGLVYNDWPLMNGRHAAGGLLTGSSLWATLAHSQGAVQLHHRLVAYHAGGGRGRAWLRGACALQGTSAEESASGWLWPGGRLPSSRRRGWACVTLLACGFRWASAIAHQLLAALALSVRPGDRLRLAGAADFSPVVTAGNDGLPVIAAIRLRGRQIAPTVRR